MTIPQRERTPRTPASPEKWNEWLERELVICDQTMFETAQLLNKIMDDERLSQGTRTQITFWHWVLDQRCVNVDATFEELRADEKLRRSQDAPPVE